MEICSPEDEINDWLGAIFLPSPVSQNFSKSPEKPVEYQTTWKTYFLIRSIEVIRNQ